MNAQQYRDNARLCRLVARTQRPKVAKLTRRMAADFDRIADQLDPNGARAGLAKHVASLWNRLQPQRLGAAQWVGGSTNRVAR